MQIKNIMSVNPVVIDKNQNVSDALRLMKKNKISRLVVTNTNEENLKEVVGIVTEKDIALKLGSSKYGNLAPAHFYVSTVMTKDLIAVDEDMSMGEVAEIMLENNIGGLPVMSNGILKGIITKSDFIDTCKGKAYEKHQVKDFMTSDLVSVYSDDRLVHARRIMFDASIGRLLVIEDDELAGIITMKDVAKAMTSFREEVPDKYKSNQIRNLHVQEAMTENVVSIYEDATIADVAEVLLEKQISGVPVKNSDGSIIGLITKTDLLELIAEMEGY